MSDVNDPVVVLVFEETITHTWSGSLSQLPIDFQNAWDADAQEWDEAEAISIFNQVKGQDLGGIFESATATHADTVCIESYHEV